MSSKQPLTPVVATPKPAATTESPQPKSSPASTSTCVASDSIASTATQTGTYYVPQPKAPCCPWAGSCKYHSGFEDEDDGYYVEVLKPVVAMALPSPAPSVSLTNTSSTSKHQHFLHLYARV